MEQDEVENDLYAKLISKGYNYRFYKLSCPIKYGIKLFGENIIRTGPVEIICISDAIDHTERLVFPARMTENGPRVTEKVQIAGIMTSLSDGGDERTVYDDSTYIKYLAKLNNLNFHYSHFEV